MIEISDGQFSGLHGEQCDEVAAMLQTAIDPQQENLEEEEDVLSGGESDGNDASDGISLQGKLIVFTGTLQIKRAEAKAIAEANGAKVGSSVTSKTDLLIVGAGVGANKMAAAEAKGVEVWTEEHFMQVCQESPSCSKVKELAGEEDPEEQPVEDYSKWTVAELKAELDARGAATSGRKAELVSRLTELGISSEPVPIEAGTQGPTEEAHSRVALSGVSGGILPLDLSKLKVRMNHWLVN